MSYRFIGSGYAEKPSMSLLDGKRLLAVDVETPSTTNRTVLGVGIACSPTEAFYFPMQQTEYGPYNPDLPIHLLSNPDITKVYHNAPFDLDALRPWKPNLTNVMDTAVMARMNLLSGVLEEAAQATNLGIWVDRMGDYLLEHGVKSPYDLTEDQLAIKCGHDCLATYALYEKLEPTTDMDYVRQEMELLPILEAMSQRGILLDQDMRADLEAEYTEDIERMLDFCDYNWGMNPGSVRQVGLTLNKRNNFLPVRRNKAGKWVIRTDKKILEKVSGQDPLAAYVLVFRRLQKLRGTYLVPWQGAERAYTHFHLDAITARVSSSNRNLQNIPPGAMRNMFLPDSGWFTDVDLSQIELRVMAHITGDPAMREVFESGQSIHQATADFMGTPYKTAKNVTFAVLYGAMAQTVMDTAHIMDKRVAQRLLDSFFRKYRKVKDWVYSVQEFGRRHGYIITLDGRKISVVREGEEEDELAIGRKCSNYPIQASAAEIMKRLLRLFAKELLEWMCNQVHDEVMVDKYIPPNQLPGCRWYQYNNGEGTWVVDGLAPFLTPIGIKHLERWE